MKLKILLLPFVFLIIGITTIKADEEEFTFQCYQDGEREKPLARYASGQNPITIRVSNRVTHQLTSRIYSIFLREILGYKNVKLVDATHVEGLNERYKLFMSFEELVNNFEYIPAIDLEVWMMPDCHITPIEIEIAGSLTDPGRIGWFIPTELIQNDFPEMIPYTMFDKPNDDILNPFSLNEVLLLDLKKKTEKKCRDKCTNGIFIPTHCENRTCAYLLAPSFEDTSFVIEHINELKLYVNVIWLGSNLQEVMNEILYLYLNIPVYKETKAKFIILYWIPSEIIQNGNKFKMIYMPPCQQMISSNSTGCKYEIAPLLKLHTREFRQAEHAYESLIRLNFKTNDIQSLLTMFEQYQRPLFTDSLNETNFGGLIIPSLMKNDNRKYGGWKKMYNEVACKWMKENNNAIQQWIPRGKDLEDIYIGGIFPLTGSGGGEGISIAALMAESAINANKTILPKHRLIVHKNDGQCRPDVVMKTFINYYLRKDRVVGILGPACSETVEPIAGVSKHFRMAMISYSAEGASYDQEKYPYFFRTIGENRQYEHVYRKLFQYMKWHRVSALTEDGQKYTEYISQMEGVLKEHGIELITNKKFPRADEQIIQGQLMDLKKLNSKIIIADINADVANIVMCLAYKLQMTAKQGYVWFLPVWLSTSFSLKKNMSTECTEIEIREALNGHFSLSHAPFATNETIMQENMTVKKWREEYAASCNLTFEVPESDYAGFAYDGVWVYAFALHKLIEEDSAYLSDLHSVNTTKRLIELIKATDFQGVSGRIRFGDRASRFSVINVLQWINGVSNIIGSFYPNISNYDKKLQDWNMVMNYSSIVWFDGKPDDGTIICTLESFANFLNADCDTAILVVTLIGCFFIVVLISAASFFFWKRRYHRKLEYTAKYMKHLGIDLLSSSKLPENTLDKWEIPKDRIVINRKLGEGAFGTVYGGEAQIMESDWTAVAVKTLKLGSSPSDRLDFLAEAEAMKRFEHKNIIKLLGVCLQSEPNYTIMEFMLYGDLKTYLLARRHLVSEKLTEDSDISPKRLTMMVTDIVRALGYLAEQKFVHRDIACRNCLVNAQRNVKIGDFGMARAMFENDYYKFNRKGMLPVRWMSPESLVLGIFTPASDIWSFGVLLYEIITFGSFPFQGLTNNQVLEHIKQGNTLTIPTGVKPHLEGLMKACWNQSYKNRPNAPLILDFISKNQRLITPCLDLPLASVQMAETDSDQMELLPGLRRRSLSPQAPNGLIKSLTLNNFDLKHAYNNTNLSYIQMNNLNVPPDISIDSVPNGSSYNNPIEPLLRRDTEISKSNSSLRRYVPMCGFSKNKSASLEREPGLSSSVL